MPQQFNVLCCYQCGTYQVHQLKKVNKWCCKICGEKQSIKKVYCTGSGADCRISVQRMNLLKGQLAEAANETVDNNQQDNLQGESIAAESNIFSKSTDFPKKNRWEQYIEAENEVSDGSDSESTSFVNYTWQREPKKGRKRKRQKSDKFIGDKKVEQVGPLSKAEIRSGRLFDNYTRFPEQQSIDNFTNYTTQGTSSSEIRNTTKICTGTSVKSKWDVFHDEEVEKCIDNVDEVKVISKISHQTGGFTQSLKDLRKTGTTNLREVQCSFSANPRKQSDIDYIAHSKDNIVKENESLGKSMHNTNSSGITKWGKYIEAESDSDVENWE